MASASFPGPVLNSHAALAELARENQYKSYHDYVSCAEKPFTDLKWARNTFGDDWYLSKSGMASSRCAVYTVDIVSPDMRTHSVVASEPQTTSSGVAKLLANAAPVLTKMRVVIFDHGKIFDHTLLQEIASFYDINPRYLRDHFDQHNAHPNIHALNAEIGDTYPGYLPSESKFSPIQLERTMLTRPKKTTLLIPTKKTDHQAVVVLIWSPVKRYSPNVINRDIIVPSQMIPSHCMNNVYQPSSDAETLLSRLLNLTSFELEACITQPILIAQPFIRTYLLEISQDIKQLRDHIDRKGLNVAIEDRDAVAPAGDLNWGKDIHWARDLNYGRSSDMPFLAFQKLNDVFIASTRSVQDHLKTPWADRLQPNMEIAQLSRDLIANDVQRVQDQMTDLRAKINEYSAYSAAQESIREARKSVAQAESVTQLTRLAFIYIPLTYATSLFGINISEWQDAGMPSGKWFVVTSILCTLLSIAVAFTLTRASSSIERHGGLLKSVIYAIKKYSLVGIFYILVTFPRMISDRLSDLFKFVRNDLFTFKRKENSMV